MPVEIVMPKLGLTMTEGLIVEWMCKVGDQVKKGGIIFSLETEKVTYEVEAPADGIIAQILVQENETAPVGAVIGYIAESSEAFEFFKTNSPADLRIQKQAGNDQKAPCQDEGTMTVPSVIDIHHEGKRVKASPLAKKVARELGIRLENIIGTGPGGWIIREDVENSHDVQPAKQSTLAMPGETVKEDKLVPFSGMRRTIARKMMASKVETAQTYMSINVDASKIIEYRKALLPEIEEQHGVRISITDMMMKVTAAAIGKHPVMNTRWTDEGILYLADVHMGMAMALDEGLIVPVIRQINQKSFAQVAKDRVELIRKGKNNSFLPDDITGSTFTLSAMGMFGIEQFTSNINIPECAILAVGAIIDKAVVMDDEIAVRPMMNITLSYDHRVIDGAEAGKFLQTLKKFIDNPINIYA